MKTKLIKNCKKLLSAYKFGELGQTIMPEDSNPGFSKNQQEMRLAYFTLPMALNYQRDSYKLWESALKTWNDKNTKDIFDIKLVSKMTEVELRKKLLKYKLAFQTNKRINNWKTISEIILKEWGSFSNFIKSTNNNFLVLKNLVQIKYKKDFPYLSGPKIFNYWSFILGEYCEIKLKNKKYIDIVPDTHITKCSVKLGVITKKEAGELSKNEISKKWRVILEGSKITPIEMHAPLWFWSRNAFIIDVVRE